MSKGRRSVGRSGVQDKDDEKRLSKSSKASKLGISDGSKGKERKESSEEDGKVKPQAVLSAYTYFSNEHVPKIKQEKGIPHKDAMVVAAALWDSLTEGEQKAYNDMSANDAKRHDQQMEEFKAQGYFTLDVATRSDDV